MHSNPNKTEAHKICFLSPAECLRPCWYQDLLPAGCLGYAGTLWTHLECFLATWDMSVWALIIQSEPYCPWDLCYKEQIEASLMVAGCSEKRNCQNKGQSVFHLAVTRSILKGSTRQCSQHGRNQYSILCTEFWGKAKLSSLPTVAFLWCLILGCSGTLSNY